MRFEYQVRPNSTFSAIFTAECGLRPVDFCQLFGGEAFKVYVRTLTANRRINSTARDFYSLYRLLKKLKRKLSFLFVGKGKRFNYEIAYRGIQPYFLHCGERLACFECKQGSDVLENFEVHFSLFGQGNYIVKRKFMYL